MVTTSNQGSWIKNEGLKMGSMRDLYCEDEEQESMRRAASGTANQQQHKGQHRCDTTAEQPRGIPSISYTTQTETQTNARTTRKTPQPDVQQTTDSTAGLLERLEIGIHRGQQNSGKQ